ncbi:MAG: histidine kinase [Bacteroidetes bacterium]|nr:MAG: histidine kinase [Bacteroidota bacterium]
MRKLFDIKRFKLYGWIGLSLFLCNVLVNLGEQHRPFLQNLSSDLWIAIYVTVASYLIFEFTLPQLSRKRIFWSVLIILGHSFVYVIGLHLWKHMGLASRIYFEPNPTLNAEQKEHDFFGFFVGAVFYFGIIRHIYNHIRLRRSAQQLLIEKQQAELNYLKSQTNPHFLFNTLNNIYSLSRAKSDLAPESILRLSKILRYMLYETSGPYAAIGQDLRIMGDYIALEKLRYDESLRVNFNNDIEDMNQAIPPLLLIPLVENAFKHGASETRSEPFVDIHLAIKNRQLLFIVKNSTDGSGENGKVKESIGLTNLRRQLELLFSDYDLNLKQEENEFIATLKINLASHV